MPDDVPSGLALEGRAMVPGAAEGDVLCLDEPLSFWGGLYERLLAYAITV